jgi:hypothetical protein
MEVTVVDGAGEDFYENIVNSKILAVKLALRNS